MRVQDLLIGKMVVTKALVAKQPPKGLVYFLHGACDDGIGLQSWINKTAKGNFAFRNFPVFYPSSPKLSYTLHEGKKESVWFDQLALSPTVPEDWGTISAVGSSLSQLIQESERDNEIPPENIIIGGFSMGGAMALHLGYRFHSNIAGVFALSTFLPPDSRLYEDMDMKISSESPPTTFDEKGNPLGDATVYTKFPRLFMSHGYHDPLVPIRWAKATFRDLRKRGVDGHFYTMQNIPHSVTNQQLSLLHDWIVKTLQDSAPKEADEKS